MARKKTHSGNHRKTGNDSKEKATENGSVKPASESLKKSNSGISFFLLAFIVVAISSVIVTYLSDDLKNIFGSPKERQSSVTETPVEKQFENLDNTEDVIKQKFTDKKPPDQASSDSEPNTFQNSDAQSIDKTTDLKTETVSQSKDSDTQTGSETRTKTAAQSRDKVTRTETDTQSKDKVDLENEQKKSSVDDSENVDKDTTKLEENKDELSEEDVKKLEVPPTDRKLESEEEKKKKQKAKKKEYAKYNITNNADYKIRKKLDEADTLLEQDRVEEAMRKYDEILKTHPNSPRALWGRGMVYDRQADQQRSNQLLEEGMAYMDKAMRLAHVPDELMVMIGKKLADRQQFRGWMAKAMLTWKYMVTKLPDDLDLHRQWGVSYLMMGQNERARDVFQQILNKRPNDGFSQVHLGFIYKVIDNDAKKGIPLLQAGIDSNEPGTDNGKFYFHLGDGYQRLNETEKAIKVYKLGAERGLFLNEHQRSLYNVDTLTGRPWWKPEQTPYQSHLKVCLSPDIKFSNRRSGDLFSLGTPVFSHLMNESLHLLEENWKIIRDEGLAQLDHRTGSFLPEDENLSDTGDWKQFTLYSRGRKHEDNCRKTPQTCALIDQIPDAKGCKRGQVKYSVMHPGVHVWPHCGPTNCRIRAHLGLVIPEGPKIRVVNDIRKWKEGRFIIFDDSFEHEVWHDGTETRLVLIVDFWHPELTTEQKRSLSPI